MLMRLVDFTMLMCKSIKKRKENHQNRLNQWLKETSYKWDQHLLLKKYKDHQNHNDRLKIIKSLSSKHL